jgi:hypothetical protein
MCNIRPTTNLLPCRMRPRESSPKQRSNHSEEPPIYKYVNIFRSVIAINYLSSEIQPFMLLQPIRIPYTFLRRKSILRFLMPSFYCTFSWMETAKRCLSECNLPFSIFRLKERRRYTYAIIYKVLAIIELLPHCDREATTFPVRRQDNASTCRFSEKSTCWKEYSRVVSVLTTCLCNVPCPTLCCGSKCDTALHIWSL